MINPREKSLKFLRHLVASLVALTVGLTVVSGISMPTGMPIVSAAYGEELIPEVRDIRVATKAARDAKSFVLVIATFEDCEWCEFVKSDYLKPLLASGELDGVALVRELPLDGLEIKDFDGKNIDPNYFANRYGARFAPTVIFLGANGEALHEPLVGVQSRDFYGFYLEKAIKKAAHRMRTDS